MLPCRSVEDYYAVLGLGHSATAAEIKAAYRFLAKALHPDRWQTDREKTLATDRFRRVANAYRVLSDPQERRHHDLLRAVRTERDQRLRQRDRAVPAARAADIITLVERGGREFRRNARIAARLARDLRRLFGS